jgi:3-mercaptopyruvate sulfurtransferase SseA
MSQSNFITVDKALSLFLSNSSIVFIDSSFKRTNQINPLEEYHEKRLPHARYFSISDFSLEDCLCPPIIPSVERFNSMASQLGISNNDHLILYGTTNSTSVSRVVSTT